MDHHASGHPQALLPASKASSSLCSCYSSRQMADHCGKLDLPTPASQLWVVYLMNLTRDRPSKHVEMLLETHANPAAYTSSNRSEAGWCACQADLALSADQQQRLLEARQQVLPEIERIVAERERLASCLQVSPDTLSHQPG